MTTTVAKTPSRYRFTRQFLLLASSYWHSDEKWKVRSLIFLLFLLTIAQVGLAIWLNYWNRELFDALEVRSLKQFLLQIGTFVAIFVLTMTVTALHMHVKRWLQLGWREWLTERLLNSWMRRGHHYQLGFTPGEHDNPDGRIAEDIRIVTETAVILAHTLVYSILILSTFIDILMGVSGSMDVPGTTFSVPGYMVLMAFLYAGVGTGLGFVFGRPLVKTTNKLQTAEANFRFGLAQARENSEAIALVHGESIERNGAARLFEDLKSSWNRQTLSYIGLVSFSSGYGALLPVFPILIAAPQYIAGTMTLGILMQAANAFQKLTSALSWPIDNLGDMAKCRASADRVLALHDELLKLEARETQDQPYRIVISKSPRNELTVRDLCITNPDGKIIMEGFNAEITQGERVLIAGDSAAATNFFKVVAGLWPWGEGEIFLPHDQSIFFMPQRPYLPKGTLRSILNYPAPAEAFDNAMEQRALECAGLGWLIQRLDETDNWDHVLSVRAQQRLGFARLFLHRPQWIFIEEASDAFDPKGEQAMMETLLSELPSATLMTISFHTALESYHTRKLVLSRLQEDKYLFDYGASCALPEHPADSQDNG